MSALSTWHTVPIGHHQLRVLVSGSGPAVLLVHGFPDDHRVWRKQVPALVAAGYQVITPDMRGCGDSSLPNNVADFDIEHLISDLVTVLDTLGINKVSVVGHDWGAVIAWQFVMAHPQRVKAYAALSVGHPFAYATDGLMQKLKGWYVLLFQLRGISELMLSARGWWLFKFLVSNPAEEDAWVERLSRPGRLTAAINYYRANVVSLLFRRRYPLVTVPVLGLWSSGDRYLTKSQMTRSSSMVKSDWRYVCIENADHWLQLEAPERVNQEILSFLEKYHD